MDIIKLTIIADFFDDFIDLCTQNLICMDLEIYIGIWVTRKHNESIEIVKKLAIINLLLLKAHEHRKHCVFIGHTYQLYPHIILSAHVHIVNLIIVSLCTHVDKDYQQVYLFIII